jgi:hypothetical protein
MDKSFAVVHITDRRMTVASRTYPPAAAADSPGGAWAWTHSKAIGAAPITTSPAVAGV